MSLNNHLISHKVSTKTILNEDLLRMILERKGYRLLFNDEYLGVFKEYEEGQLFYINKTYLYSDKLSLKIYNDKKEIIIDFDNNFLNKLLKFIMPEDEDIQAMKLVDPHDYNLLKEISFDTGFNCITKIVELHKFFRKEMDTLDNLNEMTGISNYENYVKIDEEQVYNDLRYIYTNFLSNECSISSAKNVVKYDAGVCKTILNDYLSRNGFEIIYNGGVGVPNIYNNRLRKVKDIKTIIICFNVYDTTKNPLIASPSFSKDLNYRLRMSLYDENGYKDDFYMSFFDKDFPRQLLYNVKETFHLPEKLFKDNVIHSYLNETRVSTNNIWWAFVELREILLEYMAYKDSLKGEHNVQEN